MRMPEIEKVIFNDPATIVLWSDGTKTVVKTHDEPYSKEHGLAMCIARRYFRDNRSKFKKAVDGKLDFDRNRDNNLYVSHILGELNKSIDIGYRDGRITLCSNWKS